MKKIVFYLQIAAMVFFTMSGALVGLPAAQALPVYSPGDVVLSEFQTTDSEQWFELQNNTGSDIDLDNTTWDFVYSDGSSTSTKDLTGILPAYGILTYDIAGNVYATSTGLFQIVYNGTDVIYAMTYGTMGDLGFDYLATPPAEAESAVYNLGSWSVTADPNRGWFNNAVDYDCPLESSTTPPTLSSIADCILTTTGGVTTNLDEFDDPSTMTGLYFDKAGSGRIHFDGTINFTDQSIVNAIASLGENLMIYNGQLKFPSDLDSAMNVPGGPALVFYNIGGIGFSTDTFPAITVKDDAGVIIPDGDLTFPAISGLYLDPDTGDLSFNIDHFTEFELSPTVTEVTPVPESTNVNTPDYTFNTNVAGAITYEGDCVSSISTSIIGDNTITFDTPLGDGLHDNCAITITDGGNHATTLEVSDFTVDTSEPSLNSVLGDGVRDYSLPSTCPRSAACDRGDTFGATLVFNEELNSDSKTAVENAITAGASMAPRTYVWASDRVRIYATGPVTFADDVIVDITDLAGNTTTAVTLIDSRDVNRPIIYVDDDYNSDDAGGHEWLVDAFDDIQQGIDAAEAGGTVNILAGSYYSDSSITIESNGLQIIGPGIDASQAVVQNTSCSKVFDVRASGVRIEGLVISQRDGADGLYCYSSPAIRIGNDSFGVANAVIDGNDIAGGYIGVAVNYQSASTTIENNYIHDNDAYGIVIWENVNTIQNNEILYNGWGIGMACGGDGCYDGYNLSGTEVSGNSINNNSNGGIRYYAGNQEGPVTIGPDNIITANPEGIYIYGGSYNLFINGNQIYGNLSLSSGLHVEDDSTGLDASENWWGESSGPYEEAGNPEGTGNPVTIINSSYVYYRPFCTDGDCDYLSSVEVTPDNLGSLFENGGSITPILDDPGDDDADPATVIVDSLSVNEETSIAVPAGSGTSTVVLPAGTVITKTDGGTFDANEITAADVALSGISGLASGKVVEGAFQWGVPSLGLTFSPAITVNVFVGEDLDGQTLTIYRSNSQTSGWETSGIVAPGTCVVDEGICSFQTTKASYFATARSVASSGGGLWFPTNTATGTGATVDYSLALNHNFIKLKNSGAIYWLSADNKRYLFPNREIFSSWFGDDFSGLKEISQSEFDSIPAGGNLTIKPGSYLKFDNQGAIYFVSDNTNIYLATVTPSRVYTIQASFENNYRLNGQLRKGIDLISTIINNKFVQITGQPAVYWLSPDNVRYLFTNRNVFSSWFINNFSGLRQITQAEFDQLESGDNLTIKPGSYLKFDNSDILYRVVSSNNICKSTANTPNFYQVQAGFESDYNLTGDCQ